MKLNVSGDLLWHNLLWTTAKRDSTAGNLDFRPQLAGVKDFVSRADIAVCHEEVPLAALEGPFENYPRFSAPPQVADAIAEMGWDICTTASNHTLDQGWSGLVRTVDTLRAAGVRTVGSYRNAQEASSPVMIETSNGVTVAFISQTYGLNAMPIPPDKPWAVATLDAEVARTQARAAKQAGADIVAVHMHAGTEYESTPNQQQRRFAETLTASPDVDLVFGQHAHVVQPIEKINNKWVLFGSGNLMAQSGPSQPWTYEGYLAEITFTENPDGTFEGTTVEWAPTFITKQRRDQPARVYVIPQALADGVGPARAMRNSADRTRHVVTRTAPEGLTELGR